MNGAQKQSQIISRIGILKECGICNLFIFYSMATIDTNSQEYTLRICRSFDFCKLKGLYCEAAVNVAVACWRRYFLASFSL